MISVDNLAVEFSGTTLFSDVSFVINPTDKIALMGKNGAGKSTMMKIVAGEQKGTRGNVRVPKDTVIAYLPQHLLTEDNCTVFEEAAKAFKHVFDMRDEMERLNKELETRTDYESDAYMGIIEKVSDIGEKYYALEDVNYDAEVEKALKGLGFRQEDFTRQTNEFSGGWRMRIELAKILLQKPDLILLDEPTNHIDIESVIWLEDFLLNKANAVMVISHDRAFIDNITNRTIEVTMGRIYDYKANYSHYLQLREDRRAHQIKAYQEQQKFIADNMAFIERFKGTYSKTNQVSSRERMLEKLEIIEIDEIDTSSLKLRFPPAPRSGDYPVTVTDVSKAYDDHVVFKNANMSISRGEKVSFVGRNGEGKSTMIKAILNEIPVEGTCQLGHNVKVGYFAQNQASLLDPDLTIFQTVDEVAFGDIRNQIKNILGRFMFSGDDIDKKVSMLSGGEKTRLAMVKLLLEPVNLLILDEPTNHLDLKSKDVLKEALSTYDGTLILVSHDRDFLQGLSQKVFEFKEQRVIEHFETIDAFLERNRIKSIAEINLMK
ncbi:MAG: ABC-F family ATP-binding cassette domain-containing protein [Maribacter dokdonensis]|uniref:Probable ATP-binding protein YbiT n=3 Tax=Maribacter dokdonensis TaxID=320912 RepID=A0A1H4RB46_9FLAO|nr:MULTISPECIES: ABC-F family ATP-binding cassette domain-containing protein [Maribacter]HAF78252.1 ABC transporter ATP-binding protein [Maribacter sp.]KSA13415.1 ABC transporter related [Maribacter dokdonensis DSW-8]MDP2527305.1 ABC-F family ATP-binding cassette domain-containing protein [Maribacter dokdonensis]SDS60970.1 ATP-binding cassette, subfamily F, member 3 [Maribacter dokdonensis]SEC28911.1 ATP-binding cassette, subfamily F, member 3 [Maribacter dokdonensis]|tara:strand:+ start:152003 stop:153640 length:1638 start_codon:yes stop_codon:yes gene_type:complete